MEVFRFILTSFCIYGNVLHCQASLFNTAFCGILTPLGTPVDPDVYKTAAKELRDKVSPLWISVTFSP